MFQLDFFWFQLTENPAHTCLGKKGEYQANPTEKIRDKTGYGYSQVPSEYSYLLSPLLIIRYDECQSLQVSF